MSKRIQVKGVPEKVHRTLKSRVAERPTMQEWLERTRHAKPLAPKSNAARVIRELRGER